MSKYSGKCDVGDWFSDKDDEYIKKTKFYIHTEDGRRHRLDINSQKDLLPYYPYIVCVGGHDKESSVVEISETSFCDEEEQKHISFRYDEIMKAWRKCKRRKEDFNKEEISKKYNPWNDSITEEIIDRISKNGNKAFMNGIHTGIAEYYRKKLTEDMIKAGYTEREALNWVYNEGIMGEKIAKERFEKNNI